MSAPDDPMTDDQAADALLDAIAEMRRDPYTELVDRLRALIEKWRASDYPDGLSVTAGVGYRAARWVCADELERAIGGGA